MALIRELLAPITSPTIFCCDNLAVCKMQQLTTFAPVPNIKRYKMSVGHPVPRYLLDSTFDHPVVAVVLTKALPSWKVKIFSVGFEGELWNILLDSDSVIWIDCLSRSAKKFE